MMNPEEHTMLKVKFSLYDYSDAHILVKGTITADGISVAGAAANNTNKKVILKNCALYTNYKSKISNAQIDNTQDTDIVVPVYNLIEYSNNYSRTSGSLWKYWKDIPAVNINGYFVNFTGANGTDSFNSKAKITSQIDDDGEIDNVEIMVALKYLSSFWRAIEMTLNICEINLAWSADCVICLLKLKIKVLHLQ